MAKQFTLALSSIGFHSDCNTKLKYMSHTAQLVIKILKS